MVELLVVISIISILMGILLPVLGGVRRQARTFLDMNNKRQITSAANFFATDNNNRYPDSVATIGFPWYWNWAEPMMLTARQVLSPRTHRSMSAYLRSYVENADIMYCPNAPVKYEYLQALWDAGDGWENPDFIPGMSAPASGTYCFYWNYTGYLEDKSYLFHGPKTVSGGPNQSKLMVSCYFGYDHHRSRGAYGSCERIKVADITQGTYLSSAYWSRNGNSGVPEIKLYAGYTDGHVESFLPSETATMRVIYKIETNEPYPEGVGPGEFYLPENGLR